MFSKIALFAAASMAVLVAASPVPAGQTCSTGPVQCCNSVQDAKSVDVQNAISGLLSVILGPITGQVGVTCSPITAIGLGGNSCNAQTVCCDNNNFNGVIALGCSPINLSL
ncbi:fungal hydrophobin-domain-containing protein [Crucibulum laeve]|uniref:Hydrophobin n=1 Tax=Crucibulum laeve TaxID=68775 RepID=A0A5C3M4D4_9AGAR|nr:fungal hydrophobin-domain-containing protein [Crucibulum laeve]